MLNNKFLLIALIPILFFVVSDAVSCPQKSGGSCQGDYCYYVNYTQFTVDGSSSYSDVFYGCHVNGTLIIPEKSGTTWTFPVNHCQHFQTNSTALGYAYIYGNVCDTRDNCTYKADDGNSLVCAGLRTSPLMGLSAVVVIGILIAKFFV